MRRTISNYLLADFINGKTLQEALSEEKIKELRDVISKGASETLVFNMMTLLSLYIEEPYKRPIEMSKYVVNKVTKEVMSTDKFKLSRKDFIDCKVYLFKTELGVNSSYLQADSNDVKMKSCLNKITKEFKNFIELGLGNEFSVTLTTEI